MSLCAALANLALASNTGILPRDGDEAAAIVKGATGRSLAYCYGRATKADADTAKVLTLDEARRSEQHCQVMSIFRR